MIEILFWVFLIIAIIFRPWPNAPWAGAPWATDIIHVLLFILLGLAVFGFGLHRIG